MADRLDKATFGEQGAGFFFGSRGYFLVDGPSGAGGHASNEPGFDGIAYNIALDDLIIYDNKAFKLAGNVGSGTAIDPAVNLSRNLNDLIARVSIMPDLPAQPKILSLLIQTRASITGNGAQPPKNVRIAITNFGGNSKGVAQSFAARGIAFLDMNAAPSVPKGASRIYLSQETLPRMVQFVASDVDAHEIRSGRVAALAEATRYGAQFINDQVLKRSIDGELRRLTPDVSDALVRGSGALIVININVSTTPAIIGATQARSISNAYVFAQQNGNLRDALRTWSAQGLINIGRRSNQELETCLMWVAPPSVQ
jgi:hypothetical protein